MPLPKGGGTKRTGPSTTLNGHTPHTLSKKRSQRLDNVVQSPSLGARRSSLDCDTAKSSSGDSTPDRDLDGKITSASSNGTSSMANSAHLTNAIMNGSQKQIHVGQTPGAPSVANKASTRSPYASVLPPHQYLDSLALTFFLVNLPPFVLAFIHVLFILFAVSPYSNATDRYSSWKTLLPAEAFIVLFFALASPSVRASITELAEPVIASTLAGNGGRGTAICALIMFAAGRIPDVVLGGLIRLKTNSPVLLSDTLVTTAHELDPEREIMDRFGDEWQAWILALVRQLIAVHVVARWSWEGLKQYLTNRVNQSKLEEASTSTSTADAGKKKKLVPPPSDSPKMPLWTTIANNYIVATKDAELKPPEDLPTFMLENECVLHVWEVDSCSVRLRARGSRDRLHESLGPFDSFRVNVNGLQWREVSVSLEHEDSNKSDPMYHQENFCLYIDIQALVQATAHEIQVTTPHFQTPDDILFHATICTIQKEATAAALLTPQTVRPISPISTLTEKLNTAVENLNELKNSQRRIRKDHKSTIASLRSELEGLHSRLETPDKGEERARRGNLAMKYHVMQTEEKIRVLEDDIHCAEETISNRQSQLSSGRQKWESERSALANSCRQQNSTKSSYDKFLQQFHSEKLAINAKKEKLTSREVKLKGELEVLEAAAKKKMEELDCRSKKRQDSRNQLVRERQTTQADEIKVVEQMESQLMEIKEKTARTHSERMRLESVPGVLPGHRHSQENLSGSPLLPPKRSLDGLISMSPDVRRRIESPEEGQDSLVENS